jgi:tetratricopeptide (TPR) repeat protein
MYLQTRRRPRRRRSSPVRVVILLILIGAGVYLIVGLEQEEIENPFAAPPTPTRSALSYALDGDEYYTQGDLTQAIAAYRQALALDPDDPLLHVALARLLVFDGQPEEGVQRAEEAVEVAPDNARAWAVLALAYDWSGRAGEAIDAGERAVELDPALAEAHAYLAEAYADGMRWADAMEVIETAVQLDESSVDVHHSFGWVLETQGDYQGAAEEYDRAIELQPNLSHLYIAAGRNYAWLDDLETAIDRYRRATEIEPDDPGGYDRLGWAYCINGDRERARMSLEDAIEVDPEFASAYGHMAACYWRYRDWESAIQYFEPAIDLAFRAARRETDAFFVAVHETEDDGVGRSLGEVLRGEFVYVAAEDSGGSELLQAELTPVDPEDEIWGGSGGTVTLDVRSGVCTVELTGLPLPGDAQALVGWFDGLNALDGEPLTTGPLDVEADGSASLEMPADWVEGPPIDHLYTLGLCYFYMDECDDAYPLFYAALQMNPNERNAWEGIGYCDTRAAEVAEEGEEQ